MRLPTTRPLALARTIARNFLACAVLAGCLAGAGSVATGGEKPDAGDLKRPAVPPSEAVKMFKLPEGLEISLFTAEDQVAQPISINFDDRGRLWVVQYLQYPNPAGLKPVEVDQYLRTVYDKVPEPPPHGPKGADRITIYQDTDGDGRPDTMKDFAGGLNLATSVEVGNGGVYVMQAPYLLFYPDRNADDVPDGDPEVLLSGFGINDAHSVANSLVWGPDGWLYGDQGSTVTANVRGIEFQQGVWRYHPATKRFELFSEGGGNNWGIDFDRCGNLFVGGNTLEPLCHHIQGGYYIKGWGKHGPLHNPYTYGFFPAMKHNGYLGHGLTGGFALYYGGKFPMNGTAIYPQIRQSATRWSYVKPVGSTFETFFGGDFITSSDPGYRQVDSCVGPDGALYIGDWYDYHIAHRDPVDVRKYYLARNKDGRVWKVTTPGNANKPVFTGEPLRKRSSKELVALLSNGNEWYVRQARVILSERKDKSILPDLEQLIFAGPSQETALAGLWSYYLTAGLDEALCQRLLDHPAEYIRAWTIRLLGDDEEIPEGLQAKIAALAAGDPSPIVHNQLAATARRLPGAQALPIVAGLIGHSEDMDDKFIPLMTWWVFENKAISDREAILDLVTDKDKRALPMVQKTIAPRLVRRYTAEHSDLGFASCARLLDAAPSKADSEGLIAAMDQELAGQSVASIPAPLAKSLERMLATDPIPAPLVRLGLRLGQSRAYTQALGVVKDPGAPQPERLQLIQTLGETNSSRCAADLLELLAAGPPAPIATAILMALDHSDHADIPTKILALHPSLSDPLKEQAIDLLCSRKPWALALLESIDTKTLPPSTLALSQLRLIQQRYADTKVNELLAKNWGKIRAVSNDELQQRIAALTKQIESTPGNAVSGKAIFMNSCGKCHQFLGGGTPIGPDLRNAERMRLDVLLANVLDPSGVIRPEFQSYVAVTSDGRVLSGLLAESTPRTVTLLDPTNNRIVIPRGDLEGDLKPSELSLMPEQLIDKLSVQELSDLVAYLQSDRSAKQAAAK